ncbi:MAG: phospho-N-acetylmuramoyl-pentapeptide-transferase [Deltaproteobacteria bacterium]|nr:phospho-N-acetylmuramoyl-pentapeptide-transferase [Deltaproteobacteria bacterium]
MLFHFFEWLTQYVSGVNVFRYTTTRILAAALTAMVLTFLLSPWFIKRLRDRQVGQPIREDGPETHFVKAGTPTMGGSLILFSLVIATLLWSNLTNGFVWLVLTVTVGFGMIGFADDSLKISKKNSKGLPAIVKIGLQTLIALLASIYLFRSNLFDPSVRLRLDIPFMNFYSHSASLPLVVYILFATIVVVGTSNAVNLTDGLDGLAIGPVIIDAFVYLLFAYIIGSSIIVYTNKFDAVVLAKYLLVPHLVGTEELSIYCGSLIGAGIGFLWFNTYPASVFMGDVGSLSLGAGLGAIAVATKTELVLVMVGGLFVVEAVSVIVQVGYFKLTHKRIFLMAPLHHHFEKKGWAEPKVIVRFWIVSIMLALVGLATLKMR